MNTRAYTFNGWERKQPVLTWFSFILSSEAVILLFKKKTRVVMTPVIVILLVVKLELFIVSLKNNVIMSSPKIALMSRIQQTLRFNIYISVGLLTNLITSKLRNSEVFSPMSFIDKSCSRGSCWKHLGTCMLTSASYTIYVDKNGMNVADLWLQYYIHADKLPPFFVADLPPAHLR